ncbi:unnamed protein product [Prorocentrum cordatum]|uniref:Uncharacterized protein n=1 Tax=Prorocentrum cordatum TaxID=2364126 RepID=A0ABN9V975_9DINO|nr:unnamed protein product [Polarella glacialis]
MPGPGAPGPVLRQQSPARHGATRVPSAAYSGQAQSFRGHHSFASPAPASPRLIAAPGQAVSRGSFQGAPLVAKGSSGQDPTPDRRSAEEQDRNAKERGHASK